MSLALSEAQRRIVLDILGAHLPPGVSVRAFGSRAKNSHRPGSDLDLAVQAARRLTLAELADLAEAFSESDLPFKVDIVDITSSDPAFQKIVERDGVEL